ncbi:MAG TPA: membrane protein insertase YidC, partial [Chthoniobacterales bacterium]|nr:membrane protein insertase YidC [Chthoniobacterales bacterium]
MDRQAWIAVTLCILGMIGWYAYTASHLPPPRPPIVASPTPGTTADNQPTATASPAASVAPAATATPAPAEAIPAFAEKSETLANGDVELHLTNRGGAIQEAVLLNHTGEKGERMVLNGPDRIPIGAIVENPESPAFAEFSIARQDDGSVQLERKNPDGLNIRKRFFFPASTEKKDNFVAMMEVEFRNDGPQPYNNGGYFVTLGSTSPIHPTDMPSYTRLAWFADGANGIDVTWFPEQNYPLIGVQKRPAQAVYREKVNNADWAGMTNQFFTTLNTPLNAKAVELWARPFEIKRADGPSLEGMEGAMGLPGFQLQPGQSVSMQYQLYIGPKLYARVAKLQHDEAEIMNFGMFKLVSQALLNFMNLIHGWIGNYGWSIVFLTAVVKGILWPLQNKANKSMRKMSALAPLMQELKEKHKDDPTRMNQEVMKLYKQHGVNPVGGCLPMMIQIPIFFGLFSMLGQAAELRNAAFLWVRDLSQPDTLFVIPGMGWIPILGMPGQGLPINILPILMGASNVWLMQMTPKTGDAMQRRVLMFMPLIFLIFCYNFAAALALYYTVQNLFTILQLWHNQRQPLPVLEKVAPPVTGKKPRKGRP